MTTMHIKNALFIIMTIIYSSSLAAGDYQYVVDKEYKKCGNKMSCITNIGLCEKYKSVNLFKKCINDNDIFYDRVIRNEKDRMYLAIGMSEAIFSMYLLSQKSEAFGFCLPNNATSSGLLPIVRGVIEKSYVERTPQLIFFISANERIINELKKTYPCK